MSSKEGIGDSKAGCGALCEAPQHPECVVYAVGVILMKAVDTVGNAASISWSHSKEGCHGVRLNCSKYFTG